MTRTISETEFADIIWAIRLFGFRGIPANEIQRLIKEDFDVNYSLVGLSGIVTKKSRGDYPSPNSAAWNFALGSAVVIDDRIPYYDYETLGLPVEARGCVGFVESQHASLHCPSDKDYSLSELIGHSCKIGKTLYRVIFLTKTGERAGFYSGRIDESLLRRAEESELECANAVFDGDLNLTVLADQICEDAKKKEEDRENQQVLTFQPRVIPVPDLGEEAAWEEAVWAEVSDLPLSPDDDTDEALQALDAPEAAELPDTPMETAETSTEPAEAGTTAGVPLSLLSLSEVREKGIHLQGALISAEEGNESEPEYAHIPIIENSDPNALLKEATRVSINRPEAEPYVHVPVDNSDIDALLEQAIENTGKDPDRTERREQRLKRRQDLKTGAGGLLEEVETAILAGEGYEKKKEAKTSWIVRWWKRTMSSIFSV